MMEHLPLAYPTKTFVSLNQMKTVCLGYPCIQKPCLMSPSKSKDSMSKSSQTDLLLLLLLQHHDHQLVCTTLVLSWMAFNVY